jgi:hypothetical protein
VQENTADDPAGSVLLHVLVAHGLAFLSSSSSGDAPSRPGRLDVPGGSRTQP